MADRRSTIAWYHLRDARPFESPGCGRVAAAARRRRARVSSRYPISGVPAGGPARGRHPLQMAALEQLARPRSGECVCSGPGRGMCARRAHESAGLCRRSRPYAARHRRASFRGVGQALLRDRRVATQHGRALSRCGVLVVRRRLVPQLSSGAHGRRRHADQRVACRHVCRGGAFRQHLRGCGNSRDHRVDWSAAVRIGGWIVERRACGSGATVSRCDGARAQRPGHGACRLFDDADRTRVLRQRNAAVDYRGRRACGRCRRDQVLGRLRACPSDDSVLCRARRSNSRCVGRVFRRSAAFVWPLP